MMRHCDGTDPNLRAEDGVTTPWSDAREPSGPAAGVTDAYSPGRPMAEPRQPGGLAGSRAARRRPFTSRDDRGKHLGRDTRPGEWRHNSTGHASCRRP